MFHTLPVARLIQTGTSIGIVIPKNIRDAYGWERGDTILFVYTSKNALTLRKLSDKEMEYIKDNARQIDLTTNKEIK